MKPNLKQFASVFPLILVKPINTCKHTHSSENRSRWWCATQGAHWRGNSEDDHRVQEKFNDGSGWERSSYLWESPDVTHATQARRGAEAQSAQSGAVDCLCVRVCMWQDTWRWQEGQEGPLLPHPVCLKRLVWQVPSCCRDTVNEVSKAERQMPVRDEAQQMF